MTTSISCIGPRHRPVTKPGGIPWSFCYADSGLRRHSHREGPGVPVETWPEVPCSKPSQAIPRCSLWQVPVMIFSAYAKTRDLTLDPPTPPVLVIFKVCSSHLYCLYSFVVWEAATDKWSECSSLFKHLFSVACGVKLLVSPPSTSP
jgi:hypothetical protein